jgi:hypothetical protein
LGFHPISHSPPEPRPSLSKEGFSPQTTNCSRRILVADLKALNPSDNPEVVRTDSSELEKVRAVLEKHEIVLPFTHPPFQKSFGKTPSELGVPAGVNLLDVFHEEILSGRQPNSTLTSVSFGLPVSFMKRHSRLRGGSFNYLFRTMMVEGSELPSVRERCASANWKLAWSRGVLAVQLRRTPKWFRVYKNVLRHYKGGWFVPKFTPGQSLAKALYKLACIAPNSVATMWGGTVRQCFRSPCDQLIEQVELVRKAREIADKVIYGYSGTFDHWGDSIPPKSRRWCAPMEKWIDPLSGQAGHVSRVTGLMKKGDPFYTKVQELLRATAPVPCRNFLFQGIVSLTKKVGEPAEAYGLQYQFGNKLRLSLKREGELLRSQWRRDFISSSLGVE